MLWTKDRLQRWIFGSKEEVARVEEEVEKGIEKEEVDCLIHGKFGGKNECPWC